MTLRELIGSKVELRGALLLPAVIVLVFSFFNLSSAVDQQAAIAALQVGVINLDEGIPTRAGATLRMGDQILGDLSAGLPFILTPIENEATARRALDDGEIAAAIILPPEFSRLAAGGGTAPVNVLYSDHRSVMETQFGHSLAAQIQAGMSLAVMAARTQMATAQAAPGPPPANAGPPAPPVLVRAEALYAAQDPLLLQVPFVLGFAGWMGALAGSMMLFLGTRSVLGSGTAGLVSAARIGIPLVAAFACGLMAALVTASLTGTWGEFLELWAYRWLVSAAAASMIVALLAWFGYSALLVALPIVFYQGAVSGLLAPTASAPTWIAWLDDLLPLSEMAQGVRTILIGGPDGSVPWFSTSVMLIVSLALIWAGTMTWARIRPVSTAEA